MFLILLQNWLQWRRVEQMQEQHVYHTGDVDDIPDGYYAVVTVELKPLHLQDAELLEEMAVA